MTTHAHRACRRYRRELRQRWYRFQWMHPARFARLRLAAALALPVAAGAVVVWTCYMRGGR